MSRIQEKNYVSQNYQGYTTSRQKNSLPISSGIHNQVSFKSRAGDESVKLFWLNLKRLCNSMKEVTEFTNAFIAAIGTGIIAPFIILCSPGKGDKDDKDKKFFQAIRQPLSAGLALAFQVPATYFINNQINKFAYEKKAKMFDDEVLGTLIPDKKYLAKYIDKSEIDALNEQFEVSVDGKKSLRQELEAEIRNEYKSVGLEVTDEQLEKDVKKKKAKFIKGKAIDKKYNEKILEKCNELKDKGLVIKDSALVNNDIKSFAENKFSSDIKAMEERANLSGWDKASKILGFPTKKVKKLNSEIEKFKSEKGLELLKEKEASLFTDEAAKLKRFIEVKTGSADKIFANKKFGLSLLVNLFMVTASCYALNWSHPRLKSLLDSRKENKQQSEKKVEVRA